MFYKTTIVIYSEFDPTQVELSDLAREATDGEAICVSSQTEQVEDLIDQTARSFFEV